MNDIMAYQAARTLEFVLDKYQPDGRTTEKLEMVLNIIRYCLENARTKSTHIKTNADRLTEHVRICLWRC